MPKKARPRKSKSPAATPLNPKTISRKLHAIQRQITKAHDGIARDLQDILDTLTSGSFPTHDDAVTAARTIQDLMLQLRRRAKCPTTGEPSNLRCVRAGRGKTTSFRFERSALGKQTASATSKAFPNIQLIPAPPDKRRRHNSS